MTCQMACRVHRRVAIQVITGHRARETLTTFDRHTARPRGDFERVLALATVFAVLLLAAPVLAGQSRDQQRCLNTLNRLGVLLTREQVKAAAGCVDRIARGQSTATQAQGCPLDDAAGRVARRKRAGRAHLERSRRRTAGAVVPPQPRPRGRYRTTTISAFDPVTGLNTSTTADDSTLTILGPLTSVTVRPTSTLRLVGRTYFYAAIGRDAAGETINLSQDVTWSSTDPTVARADNPEGERSRVETLTPGTTFISAVEPITGITSTASNGDAQLDVIGRLHHLVLSSEVVSLPPGHDWQVTTTGVDGAERTTNLTQEVVYSSSNPGIVAVTNEEEHRSRIVAVAPGSATISATDPVTGIKSSASGGDIVITVTGP